MQPAQKVYALGVWFCIFQEEAILLNYEEKRKAISNINNNWHLRRMTLLGKITVSKSLSASQLVYLISPLLLRSEHLK